MFRWCGPILLDNLLFKSNLISQHPSLLILFYLSAFKQYMYTSMIYVSWVSQTLRPIYLTRGSPALGADPFIVVNNCVLYNEGWKSAVRSSLLFEKSSLLIHSSSNDNFPLGFIHNHNPTFLKFLNWHSKVLIFPGKYPFPCRPCSIGGRGHIYTLSSCSAEANLLLQYAATIIIKLSQNLIQKQTYCPSNAHLSSC